MANAERSAFLYLDSETARLLGVAYDQAIASVTETDFDYIPAKRIRDLIAMVIVECARDGERDPEKIRHRALAALVAIRETVPGPRPH
jgi:hypothetical protein